VLGPQQMSDLTITGATILTSDPERPLIEDGYLVVEGREIAGLGEGGPPRTVGESIDGRDKLVTPGFVNAHTHLCMIYGRTLGTERSLVHWLTETQLPLMCAFEPDDYAISMELGAIENLKAGTTTLCEVFFSPHYQQEVDGIAAEALDRSGIRSIFFRSSNDETLYEGFSETRAEMIERSTRLVDRWSLSARTSVGVGPLAPWASSQESFHDTVELSAHHGIGIHLHTAETSDYDGLVRGRHGMGNIELLDRVGALGESVMLNHCVHIDDRDIGLIADSGSHVIHNPTSNMILASGVAPVPDLATAGVNLGLACDGPACNNSQDMIEVMKDAALLHKVVTGRPEVLLAEDVFAMATRGGARAIGMGDRLGMLKEGFLADLALIDLDAPHLTPCHDPLAALVYSARGSDVRTVIVDGEVVMRDREVLTLDESRIRARAAERARLARVNAGV